MHNNIFTNKDLYSHHFSIEDKKRRIDDFEKIYNILKSHLEPKSRVSINKDKINKYIELYKEENKNFIKNVLHHINHITYEKFCEDTYEQLDILNENLKNKKYIYILGVNTNVGSSSNDFNIYKSNLWMFMLMYNKLKNKPYDILLNLKIAIQLYGDSNDFLIVDDCMYSGSQIADEVLYKDASETLYKFPNSYLIKNDIIRKSIFKPIQTHNINIHLFVPYMSYTAWNKIQNLKLLSSLNITLYEKYILNNFNNILSDEDANKLYNFYHNFYNNLNPLELIPIFFDHKIADLISTIELILIKGQVLDNKDKRLIFTEPCDKYYNDLPKEELGKTLNCPIPPYYYFFKILKDNLM